MFICCFILFVLNIFEALRLHKSIKQRACQKR